MDYDLIEPGFPRFELSYQITVSEQLDEMVEMSGRFLPTSRMELLRLMWFWGVLLYAGFLGIIWSSRWLLGSTPSHPDPVSLVFAGVFAAYLMFRFTDPKKRARNAAGQFRRANKNSAGLYLGPTQ